MDYISLHKNVFTRCLSDSAEAKFKEAISSTLNSIPDSYAYFNPSHMDHPVNGTLGSLWSFNKEDNKKAVSYMVLFINPQIKTYIKQKMERIWHFVKLEVSHLARQS